MTLTQYGRRLDNAEWITKSAFQLKDVLLLCPILNEVHVEACIETYTYMLSNKIHLGRKLPKKTLMIGSVYFTMKRMLNPTIHELCLIFQIRAKSKIIQAIKSFRVMCADVSGMQWIFDNEEGQSNIYRYAATLGLEWGVIRSSLDYIHTNGLNVKSNKDILYALSRTCCATGMVSPTAVRILQKSKAFSQQLIL